MGLITRNTAIVLGMIVLFSCALFPFLIEDAWSGRFPLRVTLNANQPIGFVRYVSLPKIENATLVSNSDEHDYEVSFNTPEDFDGEQFVAFIPCGGRTNQLGSETRYSEFPYLVLDLTFRDKSKRRLVVDVPKGRGPRDVIVDVR